MGFNSFPKVLSVFRGGGKACRIWEQESLNLNITGIAAGTQKSPGVCFAGVQSSVSLDTSTSGAGSDPEFRVIAKASAS